MLLFIFVQLCRSSHPVHVEISRSSRDPCTQHAIGNGCALCTADSSSKRHLFSLKIWFQGDCVNFVLRRANVFFLVKAKFSMAEHAFCSSSFF